MNFELITIKPHHFLDYLYDIGISYRHEDESNVYGSNNALLCCAFQDGMFQKIKFTPHVDDICKPCKNINKEFKCEDTFNEETAKLYGTNSKQSFNYNLDILLNSSLPDIFNFDKIQNIRDVLIELKKNLNEEIINLYLWKRKKRVENTFIGIDKALKIYK